MSITPRRVVYTALLGNYEELLEQPVAATSNADFICFTDDPELTSDTWQIRVISPEFPGDMVRSARALKIRGHREVFDYDETLWIDNAVLLKRDPSEIMSDWLSTVDLAISWHDYRASIAAEFGAVMLAKFDDIDRLNEQLAHYEQFHPEILEAEVLWTAILARRWTSATHDTMRIWFDHVLRYSRRDQLSIQYALRASQQPLHVAPLNNNSSPLHEWPMAHRPAARTGSATQEMTPRTIRLEQQVDELTLAFDKVIRFRESAIEQHESTIESILSSRSWRLSQRIAHLTQGVRAPIAAARRYLTR